MSDEPTDTGFYDWWKAHYSMANLAMGAAEDAWNAATAFERERCALIAENCNSFPFEGEHIGQLIRSQPGTSKGTA